MKLLADWRLIVRRAWSIRLMLLAAVLSGFEVALQFMVLDIPHGTFAALSAMTTAAAFCARLVAQKQ